MRSICDRAVRTYAGYSQTNCVDAREGELRPRFPRKAKGVYRYFRYGDSAPSPLLGLLCGDARYSSACDRAADLLEMETKLPQSTPYSAPAKDGLGEVLFLSYHVSIVCGREISTISRNTQKMAERNYIIYADGRFYAAQIRHTEYHVAVAVYPYVYIVNFLDFFCAVWGSGAKPLVLEIKPPIAMSDRRI